MIIKGIWYQIVVNHQGTNIPYMLLIDFLLVIQV
jgi:hypothetical protein